jgi:hypothetical protein
MKILVPLFAIVCCGCDTFHGVSRYAVDLPTTPSIDCIGEALASVDGVSAVQYTREVDSGRPITLTGLKDPDVMHLYFYEYNGIRSNLYVAVGYDGRADYHHSFGCVNCVPPQETIDRIYPAMLKIDQAIADRCHFAGEIRQTCRSVRCIPPNTSLERTRDR